MGELLIGFLAAVAAGWIQRRTLRENRRLRRAWICAAIPAMALVVLSASGVGARWLMTIANLLSEVTGR